MIDFFCIAVHDIVALSTSEKEWLTDFIDHEKTLHRFVSLKSFL